MINLEAQVNNAKTWLITYKEENSNYELLICKKYKEIEQVEEDTLKAKDEIEAKQVEIDKINLEIDHVNS